MESTHLLGPAAYVSVVDFRVLGPIEVDADGRSLVLGGPKQKAVLALLIASGSKRVSTDALITGLYGDEAAPATKRTIHTYVSNLRHDLGDRLTRQGDGYVLTVAADETDAARFESGYRDGAAGLPDDPATASRLLRQALDLWRGHPYADIDGGPLSRRRDLPAQRAAGGGTPGADRRRPGARAAQRTRRRTAGAGRRIPLPREVPGATDRWPCTGRAGRPTPCGPSRRLGSSWARSSGWIRGRAPPARGPDPQPGPSSRRRAGTGHRATSRAGGRTWPMHWAHADPSVRDRVLAARDATVDRHLAGNGGLVFGVRGTAVYVAVPDIAAALDLARSVAGDDIKVAVDFGDVESRHGEVTGPPVARSARLVAMSHPGQVVLSQQAQAALDASGTTGWSVKSLGRHQLRGVDEPLMIYQAVGNGLVEDFPALVLDRLPPPVPGGHPAIAGYEVREELGEDETCVLYRAYQHSVGREVTLRSFRHDIVSDRRFIRRFEAEAQRLALLEHPHIFPVLDYWRDPERAVMVSPRLTVHSLAGVGVVTGRSRRRRPAGGTRPGGARPCPRPRGRPRRPDAGGGGFRRPGHTVPHRAGSGLDDHRDRGATHRPLHRSRGGDRRAAR